MIMKKISIFIFLLAALYSTGYDVFASDDYSEGAFDVGRFRPLFNDMPASFIELVGSDAYFAWSDSRSWEERENENIAVAFIEYFNISKEAFTGANEELRQIWANFGGAARGGSSFELYPVDLIFTFDNDLINEYFLWENTPFAHEFGMGMANVYNPLFYNLPAPFAEIVGRLEFIQWRRSRSDEERENIAISFIRDFNISREDFVAANEYMRNVSGSDFFTFDVEMINELFRPETAVDVHAGNLRIRISGEFVYIPADEQQPVIIGNRTLVPLRAVMEALGFTVGWDEQTQTASLVKQGHIVYVQIGSSDIIVDGYAAPTDVPAQIINSRTMIPVRAVSEATGFEVRWDDTSLIVDIYQ